MSDEWYLYSYCEHSILWRLKISYNLVFLYDLLASEVNPALVFNCCLFLNASIAIFIAWSMSSDMLSIALVFVTIMDSSKTKKNLRYIMDDADALVMDN